MVKIVASITEWSKWDYDTIINKIPFVPLMMITEAVTEQHSDLEESESVDLSDGSFIQGVLSRDDL